MATLPTPSVRPPGHPVASAAPVATDHDARLVVRRSAPAEHTRYLAADAQAAARLTVGDDAATRAAERPAAQGYLRPVAGVDCDRGDLRPADRALRFAFRAPAPDAHAVGAARVALAARAPWR
ncbi:MAG: hypothetical protein M5U08_16625 [Burkholderiales bacterium]|nr:hypothetical protein [Burkholderiales bacterium]